jgi:hypothetical protein
MDFHTFASAIQSAIDMPREEFSRRFKKVKYEYSNNIVLQLVSFLITIFAIYLSWTHNTALKESDCMKIFYAFFAGLFGLTYIMFYVLRDLLK